MNKKDTEYLNELSLKYFGKPYEWRKLRKQGLLIGHDRETGYKRRTPLGFKQIKQYMEKTIEMREAVNNEAKRQSDSKSNT